MGMSTNGSQAGDRTHELLADIGTAVRLAHEADYERATSAFELLLVTNLARDNRVPPSDIALLPICDALVESIPHDELHEPVEGIANCPTETVQKWLDDWGDSLPVLNDFGSLTISDERDTVPGWVDFVLDVTPTGEPENVEMVYRSHWSLAEPSVAWIESVTFTPGRFRGEPATYRSVRVRVEFVSDDDE